jgi:hypothetical protein
VWEPAQYGLDVPAEPPVRARERSRVRFDVSLQQLVDRGLLPVGCALVGTHRGASYQAELTQDARIRVESGDEFESPSPAAMAVLDKQSWNGWMFWKMVGTDGELTGLDEIRKAAIEQGALADT